MNVVLAVNAAVVNVAVPDAPIVIVWLAPVPILYVMVVFGVPVNVMVLVCPLHTVVGEAEIVAVGLGNTVTTIVSEAAPQVPFGSIVFIMILNVPPFRTGFPLGIV